MKHLPLLTFIFYAYIGRAAMTIETLHEIEGCPTNSLCSKEFGREYQRWLSFTQKLGPNEKHNREKLENYRQRYGLPVEILTKDDIHTQLPVALWDSPCVHTRETQYKGHFIGEMFIKETSSAPKFLDPLLIVQIDKDNQVQLDHLITLYVPHEQTPIQLEFPSKAYFTYQESGHYYHLEIASTGKWRVKDPLITTRQHRSYGQKWDEGKESDCPAALVAYFQKNHNEEKLFAQVSCRRFLLPELKLNKPVKADQNLPPTYFVLIAQSC